MNFTLSITPITALLILLSLIVLGVVFFLRGKFVEVKAANALFNAQSLTKSREAAAMPAEKKVSFADFLRANKLMVSILALVIPFLLAVATFELSGEDYMDYDIIGPWGITALVVCVLSGFLIFRYLRRL